MTASKELSLQDFIAAVSARLVALAHPVPSGLSREFYFETCQDSQDAGKSAEETANEWIADSAKGGAA